MQGTLRRLTCLTAAGLTALGLASCGGDGGGGDSSTPSPGGAKGGKQGGAIRVGLGNAPDSLDPGLSFQAETWQTIWSVYTGLLTYKHAEGAEGADVVPGLAEALPAVSGGGRTYKLRLRPALKYSDGTPVKASDFEQTLKRAARIESPGRDFFSVIKGYAAYAEAGKDAGDISGITSDDRTRDITITLTEPDGRFPNILAMTFAALLPGDTPLKNLSSDPPPGVGPYRIQDVVANRRYSLVKVPAYEVGDLPQGKLAKIDVEVIKNRRRLTQDTTRNRIDVMTDPPAPDQIRQVREQFAGKRYREYPTNSIYYFFLNEREPPFDDLRVRQAANFAVGKDAISRLYGGLMEPTCNFLPPAVTGFQALDPCPYGDPEARQPNLARARALVAQAGARGAAVTVYGSDGEEFKPSAEYFADQLRKIGLNAKARILEEGQYFDALGDPKEKQQAGISPFFQDFPHPSDFFQLVSKAGIETRYNVGFVDDPVIERALSKADAQQLGTVLDDYAAIDRRIVQQAHVVPFGNRISTVFMSERMNFGSECNLVHPVYLSDYTSLCLE